MDGEPKEQGLLKDGKKSIIDATLRFRLVDDSIKRDTKQLVINITRTRMDDVPADHPVSVILKRFAGKVARIALRNPAGSPDFTSESWKQDYANRCTDKVVDDPDYDSALEETKSQILKSLPADRVQQTPKRFRQNDISLTLLPLANKAIIIANMINSGNNPNLLELTPKEVVKEQDRTSKMVQEAGKEVSYVPKNWPIRKS